MSHLLNKKNLILATLVALMAATRMHHFGTPLHMPDASLAVFLLAGFLVASPLLFGALMIEAVALDYVAITQLGVDNYCITPAYWFLIPTYGVLWFAGRYYARVHQNSLRSLGLFSAISLLAVNLAFVISNVSFYFLSERVGETSFAEYAAGLTQYYVPYVSGAVIYLVPAVMLYALLARHTETQSSIAS